MLPDIQPGNTKILYFFNCLLDGMHTRYHLMPTESISVARGCSREYFLYKRNIPCITIEVGVGVAPLSGREFNSIWNKNKNVVIREAQLFD